MTFKEEPYIKTQEKCESDEEESSEDDSFADNTITCHICDCLFLNEREYNRHIYNVDLSLFVCCKCGSKFVDEKTIRQHMRDHTLQQNSNKVLIIPNKQKQISDLAKSGKLIDTRINDKFICKYCDRDFMETSEFFDHYMGHLGRPAKNTQKETAQSAFLFNGKPVKDQFKVERLYCEIKYFCGLCGQGFNKFMKQKKHQKSCMTKMEWICSICQYEFKNSRDLFLHYDIAHRHLSRMCKYCFATYTHEKELVKHILEEHLDYTYYCFDCCEGFFAYNTYKSHCKHH